MSRINPPDTVQNLRHAANATYVMGKLFYRTVTGVLTAPIAVAETLAFLNNDPATDTLTKARQFLWKQTTHGLEKDLKLFQLLS